MTKRNCTCPQCNNQFKPRNKTSKFCGIDCYRAFQKTDEYLDNYSKKRTLDKNRHSCTNCGDEVVRQVSTRRNGEKADYVYCNRKCYDDHRSSIRAKVTGQCKHCDTDLSKAVTGSANSVYCSMDCRNKDVRPNPRPCINCKVVFEPIKYHSDGDRYSWDDSKKTCSTKCLREFYRTDESRKEKISAAFKGDKHPNWLGGVSHHKRSFRGVDWQELRQQAMKRDGHKCCHCGISHDEQFERYNRSFSINHIVPFFQSVTTEKANKLSNLETLCDSCHTKADWDYRKNNPMQGLLNFGSH